MKHGSGIFGVETEFGCLVDDEALAASGSKIRNPEQAVEAIKDHLFFESRIGAIDMHSRDMVFEPAQAGGFLMNGARLYIDAVGSHLEYATAECRQLKDLVANDRAGQRHIVRAIKELGLSEGVRVYNNSVDHFSGHTFGCHENYQIYASDEFYNLQVFQFYPFLVTRQIFAGVGRVGGHILTAGGRPNIDEMNANPVDYIWVSNVYNVIADDRIHFQLSQRADHIIKTLATRVRFNRALINPKWEHFYSNDGMTRLHLLFGEGNQNEYAYALKVGTTALVIRLLQDGLVPPDLVLAQPLIALREVSRDPEYKWLVMMADGVTIRAVDVQRIYLKLATDAYKGESEQTNWVLAEWESILDGLEKNPLELGDRIDWVAKKRVVEQYIEDAGTDWSDDALHSVDLEYHNIDPAEGLFYALQEMGETKRVVSEMDIVTAMTDPPQDTRAKGRAKLVEKVAKPKGPRDYLIDWNGVVIGSHVYDMPDPYETYAHEN
ncbi:MAG: proteasome accessory factor PafA2 family protein [Armatimonadetes bacterium]|nr:proteasome accessory factor PafA2 family protein [Armatimonadota bacterium]